MAAWADELTLISQQPPDERVNAGGFENEQQESARTVFCNKKSVGYSEYFKSQQTGKVVEAKCEVHAVACLPYIFTYNADILKLSQTCRGTVLRFY